MFSVLADTIFPYCGEFFGKLVAVANVPWGEFINFLASNVGYFGLELTYKNMYTGVISNFTFLNGIPLVVTQIFSPIIALIFVGVPSSLPLWCAILLSTIEVYFLVAFTSFILRAF